jgi:hypothetical protein
MKIFDARSVRARIAVIIRSRTPAETGDDGGVGLIFSKIVFRFA